MKTFPFIYFLAINLITTFVTAFPSQAEDLKQLPSHIGGRVLIEVTPQGNKSYEYSWPSIYFETAFKGEAITLKFDDDQNIFQLIVDGGAPVIINKPGKMEYPVKNLTLGNHTVRLEKITETQTSSGRFLGFYTGDNKSAKSLPKRKRQIEFIGDSFSVGYGNASTTRECTEQDVFKATNSQLSFGPLTAKSFNADYQVNAFSGLGVVRNYSGITPERNLPKIYPYTLNTPSDLYRGNWQPQVIVIALGNNDFSTALKADERWTSREQLQSDYVNSYVDFVKNLHKKNRSAQFILMASDQFKGEISSHVSQVVTALKTAGVKKVDTVFFSGLDYGGCHWHPSVRDDKLIADLLIAKLKAKVKWQPE